MVQEHDARRIAKLLAANLAQPVSNLEPDYKVPITLIEILQLGFAMAVTYRKHFPDVKDEFVIPEEFLAAIYATPSDPEILNNFFYDALLKSNEDPVALEAQIQATMNGEKLTGPLRKFLLRVVDTMAPPGLPGPARKITPADFRALVERIEAIRPMIEHILKLQADHPRQDISVSIDFLQPEFPRDYVYLKQRAQLLEKVQSHSSVVASAKTLKGKAHILADLVAGSDYGLSEGYALQKAKEARRAVRGKQRKREPRLQKLQAAVLGRIRHKS